MKRDFLIEKRVFEDGGDVFGEKHQSFEIVIVETLARDAMPEKEPPDDSAPSVQRHDDFGAEGIERAPHDIALSLADGLGEIASGDEVCMQFEPADEGIAFAIFDLVGFGQAAQSSPQTIPVALPDFRKNAHAPDAGGIGYALDHAGEQSLDVIETPEDARETHRRFAAFGSGFDLLKRLCHSGYDGLISQFPILLQHPQMFEGPRDQRL